MELKECKSISELISSIKSNAEDLTRVFSIRIIENDLYVENKYILKKFTGNDLTKINHYIYQSRYYTTSIDASRDDKTEINFFK